MRTRFFFGLLSALCVLPLANPSRAALAPPQTPGQPPKPVLTLSCDASVTAPFTGSKCGCGATHQAAANDAGGQNVNPGGGVRCASCGPGQGRCAQTFTMSVGVTVTFTPKGDDMWKATFTAPAGGGDLGASCEACP